MQALHNLGPSVGAMHAQFLKAHGARSGAMYATCGLRTCSATCVHHAARLRIPSLTTGAPTPPSSQLPGSPLSKIRPSVLTSVAAARACKCRDTEGRGGLTQEHPEGVHWTLRHPCVTIKLRCYPSYREAYKYAASATSEAGDERSRRTSAAPPLIARCAVLPCWTAIGHSRVGHDRVGRTVAAAHALCMRRRRERELDRPASTCCA
eukprot:362856-Chlamydomonas_euryale.AAC.21